MVCKFVEEFIIMSKLKFNSPFESSTPVARSRTEGRAKSKHYSGVETASHNAIDSVNRCFICNEKMKRLEANGVDSYVCLQHRVCLPCEND